MDALILAAGRGTRMGDLETPKCLIDLGDTKIIDYQINCFREVGIKNIFVVTGYNSEMISNHIGNQAIFVKNPDYATTNNLHSLWSAKQILKNDFVCVYSDLFFDKRILQKCVNDTNDICLAIEKNVRDETMRVTIKNNFIVKVNKLISDECAHGNFIGMAKFKKSSINSLFMEISKLVSKQNHNLYYTSAIESMIKNGEKINFIDTDNLDWIDMDEKHEIEIAKKLYKKIIEADF